MADLGRGWSRQRAQRRAWRSVRDLVPASGEVDHLVAAVASRRGRPIRVLGCPLEEGAPSGFWLRTAELDYVVHPTGVASEHRRIVVCHELAHMLLEHGPSEAGSGGYDLAPSIDPAVAARFFARHGYRDEAEADAELLATELAVELARRRTSHHAAAVLADDVVSTRLR